MMVRSCGIIRAAKVNEAIARLNTDQVAGQLRMEFEQSRNRLLKNKQVIDYYEQTGTSQSKQIMSQAEASFLKGNIDYLQWTLLMSQAYEIRINYLDAVRAYNLAVADLQFYLTSN